MTILLYLLKERITVCWMDSIDSEYVHPEYAYLLLHDLIPELAKETGSRGGLALDHQGEQTKYSSSLLHTLGYEGLHVQGYHDAPQVITSRLTSIAENAHGNILTMAGYAFHHFSEEQMRSSLRSLRIISADSAVIATDYALAGMDKSTVSSAVMTSVEQKKIAEYGTFDKWLESHCQFNRERLETLFKEAGFQNILMRNLSLGRTTIFASMDRGIDFEKFLSRKV